MDNIEQIKEETEVQRIKDFYAKRKNRSTGKYSDLFCLSRRIEIKKAAEKDSPLNNKKILDIGCGDGAILEYFLDDNVPQKNLYGIDILFDRIEKARKNFPDMCIVCGNAEKLSYPDNFFDIITQATVFTSILDPTMKKNIADEMHRILKPGGIIIWHDFIFKNPLNPYTKGIGKKEIKKLFPLCQYEFKLITLNPFIGRIMAEFSWKLCEILEKIPFLRTHWLVRIKKQ